MPETEKPVESGSTLKHALSVAGVWLSVFSVAFVFFAIREKLAGRHSFDLDWSVLLPPLIAIIAGVLQFVPRVGHTLFFIFILIITPNDAGPASWEVSIFDLMYIIVVSIDGWVLSPRIHHKKVQVLLNVLLPQCIHLLAYLDVRFRSSY